MRHIILTTLIFLLSLAKSVSQVENDPFYSLEDIIGDQPESTGNEVDCTPILDDLQYFKENPLNLNSATFSDLNEIHFLNDVQINNLLAYINSNGQLLSVFELQYISCFSNDVINKILPYITVQPVKEQEKIPWAKAIKSGRNQFYLKSKRVLEKQKGYEPVNDAMLSQNNSHYLGSPYQCYFRWMYNYKSFISAGIISEKDAGEEFFKGSEKQGFDYYSAHFILHGSGIIKTLVIGDFDVQFGQGLTLWTGFSAGGNTSGLLNSLRNPQYFTAHTNSDENRFMRGAGVTISSGSYDFSFFLSDNRMDANVLPADSTNSGKLTVSSFPTSGNHTTMHEIAGKNAVKARTAGAHLDYVSEHLKIGISGIYYGFNAIVEPGSAPYDKFSLSGSSDYRAGFDYRLRYDKFTIYGEEAFDKHNSVAMMNSAVFETMPQLLFCIQQRKIDRGFHGLYASLPGEGSAISSENGVYLGLELYPARNWKILAGFDSYRFPWLKYGVDAPSFESTFSILLSYLPSREFTLSLGIKNDVKSGNIITEHNPSVVLADSKKQNFRFNVSSHLSPDLSLIYRIEQVNFSRTSSLEHGFLALQDIRYSLEKIPVCISFRYAIFDSDSYDSGLNACEDDLLYEFSSCSLSGKGNRIYLVVRYEQSKKICLWLKFTQTYYDRNTLNTGLNFINGPAKSEIKVMLRIIM
ncbi:MAG: helix-hairpin-helix domain-containing protein [Bacteroidia bacterium]|nr:helix-hairpin-helix domain-containing protein [Bacteroidia bacterium]